jgi:flavin reductase (DIM6/NTAB) family NADH-FMN oxidoreductase RutF
MTQTLLRPAPIALDELLPPRSVDGADFRQALSRLAAGVTIITTVDAEGRKLGLTATAVTSVSLDPPLVLACIDNRSRTIEAIEDGARFIIHFLAADQEAIARQFASRSDDKFAGVAYEWSDGGAPRLEGALASVECVTYAWYPGGDHTILIGRVVEVQTRDDDAAPLMYFRGQFLQA